MAVRAKREKRERAGKSLNLILWCAFSLFALLVVVVFVLVQNALVVRQYRESALNVLREAGEEMSAEIASSPGPSTRLERRLINIANDYGLTVALFYEGGEPVFDLTEQTDFSAFAAFLQEMWDADETMSFYVSEQENSIVLARMVTVGERPAFLYLSASMQGHLDLETGLRWMSVITALVAVVLAFVMSGFVASFITRSVTEVTTRAQELARGNYDIRFRKDYFCSEIRELSDALDHARSEIAKADTMQKELIANVSHDFKTPLTMIKAYASMIREISGENKQKRDAHAKVIIDECDRLTMLVSDLLDLSKLRAGVDGEENIVLLDPNILACKDHMELLGQLEQSGAFVDFTQGIDCRLLTPENIRAINRVRIKEIHFAWDYMKETAAVLRGLELYGAMAARKPHGQFGTVYVLTNFDTTMDENLYRIYTLRDMGYDPYVMIYDKAKAPQEIRYLQRWCNNRLIFRSQPDFSKYDPKRG